MCHLEGEDPRKEEEENTCTCEAGPGSREPEQERSPGQRLTEPLSREPLESHWGPGNPTAVPGDNCDTQGKGLFFLPCTTWLGFSTWRIHRAQSIFCAFRGSGREPEGQGPSPVVVGAMSCCSETLPANLTGKRAGQGKRTPPRQHLMRKDLFVTIHVAPNPTLPILPRNRKR